MFFEVRIRDVEDRVLASLRYCSVDLPTRDKAASPRMQCGLRGCRRIAPEMSRTPLLFVAETARVAAAPLLREAKFGAAYVKAARAMKEVTALPEVMQHRGRQYLEQLGDVLDERLWAAVPA